MENKIEIENSFENEEYLRAAKPAGEFQLYVIYRLLIFYEKFFFNNFLIY